MFAFAQPASPVVQAHLDSQAAFFNALSRSLSSSIQNVFQANMQLSQAMLEESIGAGRKMLSSQSASSVLDVVSSQSQPASDSLRAYRQQLSRLAADSNVDLARITQEHVQETARTVHALAEEATRVAAEQSDRNKQRQEEALKNVRAPFAADGVPRGNNSPEARTSPQRGANLQADGGGGNGAFPGNRQGQPQSGQQTGNTKSGKPV
jgi:phasin family protein